MKNLFTGAMVLFLLISACSQKVDLEVEKARVKDVVDQITGVLETEDMEQLSQITANNEDIVIFGTDADERIVGWPDLKKLMQKQFATTETKKISVRDQVIKLHDSGQVAWFSQRADWQISIQGKDFQLDGVRISGVLEKRDGRWVNVQLHYSLPVAGSAVEN